MYSVFNVDTSVKGGSFLRKTLYNSDIQGDFRYIDYFQQPIIRGSSTINNEDSAHSKGSLPNYVSFYVKSIKIDYELNTYTFTNVTYGTFAFYIVLFKFPYKDDEDVKSKLISTNRTDGIVLYSHPECVLSYDCIPVDVNNTSKKPESGFLIYNKPFIVRPNDYVGVFYYCKHYTSVTKVLYSVNSTAKVVFKPL